MDSGGNEERAAELRVAVSTAALMIRDEQLCAALVKRAAAPQVAGWSLPGGALRSVGEAGAETLLECAKRTFLEATGLELEAPFLAQLATYDSRGDEGAGAGRAALTVAHIAVLPTFEQPRPGPGCSDARWLPVSEVLLGSRRMASGDGRILADAAARITELVESTALATAFCEEWFTVSYLRRVYEVVWDLPRDTLDPGNFHHRVTKMPGYIEAIGRDEVVARETETAEVERRLGIPATVGASMRGRPPQYFRQGALVRERGVDARLERPLSRPPNGGAA